uniref:DSL domain-containing protein n=1 Tax=Strongyloides venezuelensis TaxID=75913 RepID=A0A0K0FYH2_STRVS
MEEFKMLFMIVLSLLHTIIGQMNVEMEIVFNNKEYEQLCQNYTTNIHITISVDPRNNDQNSKTVLAQYLTENLYKKRIKANFQGNWTNLSKTLHTVIQSQCPIMMLKDFVITIPQHLDSSGNIWKYPSYPSDINLTFNFTCISGSYGPTCTKFCESPLDSNLHCDSNGKLICNDGFKFRDEDKKYCIPICFESCNKSGGKCISPGVCLCNDRKAREDCQVCEEPCLINKGISNNNLISNSDCFYNGVSIPNNKIREFLCELVLCNNTKIHIIENVCTSNNCRVQKSMCSSTKECVPFEKYPDYCLSGPCSMKKKQYFCDIISSNCTECLSFTKWLSEGMKRKTKNNLYFILNDSPIKNKIKFSDFTREIFLLLQKAEMFDIFINFDKLIVNKMNVLVLSIYSPSISEKEAKNQVEGILRFSQNRSLTMRRFNKYDLVEEKFKKESITKDEATMSIFFSILSYNYIFFGIFIFFGLLICIFIFFLILLLRPLFCSREKLSNVDILVVSGPVISEEKRHLIRIKSILRNNSPPPEYKEKETTTL